MYSFKESNRSGFAQPEVPISESFDAEPIPSLQWCSGFMDGDGCISITKQRMPGRKNLTYRLRLTLVQNSIETLLAFQRAMAEHSFVTTPGPRIEHNRQIYSLIYDGRHALNALVKLSPHLIRKRVEAVGAIRFWHEGRMGSYPGPRGFGPEVWAARAYWFNKLKKLK